MYLILVYLYTLISQMFLDKVAKTAHKHTGFIYAFYMTLALFTLEIIFSEVAVTHGRSPPLKLILGCFWKETERNVKQSTEIK